MATTCEGAWGYPRYIGGESDLDPVISVQRCTGCGELWAIRNGRDGGMYPAGTSDEEIVRKVLGKRFAA